MKSDREVSSLLTMLAVGTANGCIKMLDPFSSKERQSIHAYPRFVEALAMSPCGSAMASVGGLGTATCACIWDVATGEKWFRLTGHDGTGTCCCSPNENGRVTVHRDCPIIGHSAEIQAIAWSSCGQFIATGGKVCVPIPAVGFWAHGRRLGACFLARLQCKSRLFPGLPQPSVS